MRSADVAGSRGDPAADCVEPAHVELVGVSKSYPGVRALHRVNLVLQPGSVTAIAGENGAGKSTFIKILAGAVRPDEGQVLLDGSVLPASPRAVIDAGVSVIYQELTDVPDMSVGENLVLGHQPSRLGLVDRRKIERTARQALVRVGLGDLSTRTPIRNLSLPKRQLVEIARCLARNARVLVFDEPTSSLPESDVQALLQTIRQLREAGLTILYVSHHLDELFAVADRIAILRDGELVADGPVAEWDESRLISTMLAKDLEHAYPWSFREPGPERLVVDGLTAQGVRGASIHARQREVVGLVGLAGAGRTELMKAIAGFSPTSAGTVTIDGARVRPGRPASSSAAGVAYAPEDRKVEGLVLEGSVEDNLSYGLYGRFSTVGWLCRKAQRDFVLGAIRRFGVKTSTPRTLVGKLSGGNQQKVVLARVAGREPKVVLLDDPTRGVDVGAKSGIHSQVLSMAEDGVTVLLTSSDTDEVLAVADRVYVLRGGRVVAEVPRSQFDRETILRLAAAG